MSARLQAMRDARKSNSQRISEDSDEESSSGKSEGSIQKDDDDDSTTDDDDEEEEEEVEENVEEEALEHEEITEGEEDDDHEDDGADDLTSVKELTETNEIDRSMTFVCEAAGDFTAEEQSDLSFQKGDVLTIIGIRQDGWWEAENQDGKRGMVPSTFLNVPEKVQQILDGMHTSPQNYEKGKLWDKVRHSIQQSQALDGALSALGALPLGFCQSFLGNLVEEDQRYTTEAFLIPKLHETGLSFRDLRWSSSSLSLKPLTVHLQRVIRLVAFRQVVPPGLGFDVTSRHVRVCLHDGSKVLSNVHVIKAQWDPKAPKIWTFIPKVSSGGSSLEEGQFFIRSNTKSPTVGVLFQLCVTYTRISTGDTGEMSCGWVFMRLLDDSGLTVPNRTRILRIQPGVPFVSQMNSPSNTGDKSGGLRLFANRAKKPRLVVSILPIKKKNEQLLNFLPTVIVAPVCAISVTAMYRKVLADKLLKERMSFDSTELVQSPLLANFPKMFSQPDVLDAFRKLWSERSKKLKNSPKYEENKKALFQQLFMETAFLMLQCMTLPQFSLGDLKSQQERKSEISRIVKLVKEHGPLAVAMSAGYQFRPLGITSLALDVIGKYSIHIEGIE